MNSYRRIGLILVAAPLVLLQACAYQRPAEVTAQMARTETTLKQAEQSGATEKSLPELQAAKDKYADAQKALEKKNKEGDRVAMQLAQQAQVDAQFASAKAQSARQNEAARAVTDGTNALREEANRPAPAPTSRPVQ